MSEINVIETDAELSSVPQKETDPVTDNGEVYRKNFIFQHISPGELSGGGRIHRSAEDIRKPSPTWIPMTDVRAVRRNTVASDRPKTTVQLDDVTATEETADTSFCHDFAMGDLSLNSDTISDNDFDTMGSLETMSGHHEPMDYPPIPRGNLLTHHTLPKTKMKTYSSFSPVDRRRSSDKLLQLEKEVEEEELRARWKRRTLFCRLIILMVTTCFLLFGSIYACVYLQQTWDQTDELVQHDVNHFLLKFAIFSIAVLTINSWMIVKIFRE